MSPINRVLIVGGGTGGLSTAIALGKVGVSSAIVEKKQDWTVLGSGVTMMGATLRALGELGLAEECVRRGAGCQEVVICDHEGNRVDSVPVARVAGPGLPAMAGIMRPELHGMLVDAARDAGTEVRLATTVTSVTPIDGGATVRFSDGSESSYDLVVAADGIHSEVRDRLWGEEYRPSYTGQTVWRALVPRPTDYAELSMFYGPRSKAGINAVSETTAYLFMNTTGTERPPRQEWPEIVRGFLADFAGPLAEIRESIEDPDLIDCRPLQANLVGAPWNRGSVFLVGDAAHAPTPQIAMGAGLAVEDAIVLSRLVGEGLSGHELAHGYTERRFPRCRMAVENSLQLDAWERMHGSPDADPGRLSAETWAALGEPI